MNGNGLLGLLIIAAMIWCFCSGGKRSATGHFHGGRGMSRTRATHEAGHYVAGRAVGASTTIRPDGNVDARGLPNARAQIVFQLAGRYAAGTGAGCSGDDASIRAALNEYPADQRARVMRGAEREARRIVASRRGEISRIADALAREK